MAVRRSANPEVLARKRAKHLARVRRTVNKVQRGRIAIEDVAPDLRKFVDEELDRRSQRGKP